MMNVSYPLPSPNNGYAANAGESANPSLWHKLGCAWVPALCQTGVLLRDYNRRFGPVTHNVPWTMQTPCGPVLHWANVSAQTVTLPVLPLGSTGTLVAMVRFTDFTTAGCLFRQIDSGPKLLDFGNYSSDAGAVYFGWYESGTNYRFTVTPAVLGISAGVFASIAFTWNLATTTQVVYVNGVPKGSKTDALGVHTPATGPVLGDNTAGGSGEYEMQGDLASLLWYDRVLSSNELQLLACDFMAPFRVRQPMRYVEASSRRRRLFYSGAA